MSSLIRYFVTYPCPYCQAELEAEPDRWDGWLLCPSCGGAALPPEMLFGHPRVRRHAAGSVGDADLDGTIVIEGDEKGPNGPPRGPWKPADAPAGPARATTTAAVSFHRVIYLTGLAVSLFLFLVLYLDRNEDLLGLCGGMAIVFFLLLLRSPRYQRRGQERTNNDR